MDRRFEKWLNECLDLLEWPHSASPLLEKDANWELVWRQGFSPLEAVKYALNSIIGTDDKTKKQS